MIRKLRSRLTYANVLATIAIFVALGGSAYALSITGDEVVDGSLSDADIATIKNSDGVVKLALGETKTILRRGPVRLKANCTLDGANTRAEVTVSSTAEGTVAVAGPSGGPLPVGLERQLINADGAPEETEAGSTTLFVARPNGKMFTGLTGTGIHALGADCYAVATTLGD